MRAYTTRSIPDPLLVGGSEMERGGGNIHQIIHITK